MQIWIDPNRSDWILGYAVLVYTKNKKEHEARNEDVSYGDYSDSSWHGFWRDILVELENTCTH